MPRRHSNSRRSGLAVLLALCAAGPVLGDELDNLVARYGAGFDGCYDASGTDALADCKGILAEPCMEIEEGGYSTLGMVFCMAAETRAWDGRLNAEYRASMDWARGMDEDERALFPEFATRAEALREAQRAWIAFRDAQCGLDYAVWGSGSMRQIAGASCQMEMTANRSITLRALRETMQ